MYDRYYDVGTHRDNGDAPMDCVMRFEVRSLGKSGLHIGKRNASSVWKAVRPETAKPYVVMVPRKATKEIHT